MTVGGVDIVTYTAGTVPTWLTGSGVSVASGVGVSNAVGVGAAVEPAAGVPCLVTVVDAAEAVPTDGVATAVVVGPMPPGGGVTGTPPPPGGGVAVRKPGPPLSAPEDELAVVVLVVLVEVASAIPPAGAGWPLQATRLATVRITRRCRARSIPSVSPPGRCVGATSIPPVLSRLACDYLLSFTERRYVRSRCAVDWLPATTVLRAGRQRLTTFSYELGDAAAPRGHALLVFHAGQDQSKVWATYLVVPPVIMDFAKYLPPMLASLAPMAGMGAGSAVPMPPVPEEVDGMATVRRLALARGDDLLDAGTIDVTAMDRMMLATAEAAQRYYDAYSTHIRTIPSAPVAVQALQAIDEDASAYRAMPEGERLGELSKLIGKLRYAMSGHDEHLAKEAIQQIQALGSSLPSKYRAEDLLSAAQQEGAQADRLASLYMDRCFKLFREEYEALPELEAQIRELREGGS